MTLVEYVRENATRGECRCGQCVDVGDTLDPVGHTVDMHFITVGSTGKGDANTLRQLIAEHNGACIKRNHIVHIYGSPVHHPGNDKADSDGQSNYWF